MLPLLEHPGYVLRSHYDQLVSAVPQIVLLSLLLYTIFLGLVALVFYYSGSFWSWGISMTEMLERQVRSVLATTQVGGYHVLITNAIPHYFPRYPSKDKLLVHSLSRRINVLVGTFEDDAQASYQLFEDIGFRSEMVAMPPSALYTNGVGSVVMFNAGDIYLRIPSMEANADQISLWVRTTDGSWTFAAPGTAHPSRDGYVLRVLGNLEAAWMCSKV